MGYILDTLGRLLAVIQSISVFDIIDMLLLSYLIYKGIKLMRETRAEQLIKGIGLICVAYFFVRQMNLKTIGFLLENFFQFGILAIIIMFQPELRRALEKVGRTKVSKFNMFSLNSNFDDDEVLRWNLAISSICESSHILSSSKTGALMVIERQTRLGEQIDTGTVIGAIPSVEVITNIFYPNTPLHDGAVIFRDGRLHAAGCFLPKPQKEEFLNKQLGSRHRAAIGMSEISDAIIIIVSEETGIISVAEDGKLDRAFSRETLRRYLKERILPEPKIDDKDSKEKITFIGKVKSLWQKEK